MGYSITEKDYKISLYHLVAAGKYDEIHPQIPFGLFLQDEESSCIITLLHLDRKVTGREVCRGLEHQTYFHLATMKQILAFGAKFPNIQKEFPIHGLGSTWFNRMTDDREHPVLFYDEHQGRCLLAGSVDILAISESSRFAVASQA